MHFGDFSLLLIPVLLLNKCMNAYIHVPVCMYVCKRNEKLVPETMI